MSAKFRPAESRRQSLDDIFLAQRLQWAVAEASRCLMCDNPPCQTGCKAGVEIKKFIRALKNRNLRGAAAAVREGNFLVATCGRVCPQGELCEKSCSATGLDRPIAIGELQRFVGETAIKERMRPTFPEPTSRGEVAILGAGPAGLSAAFYLRLGGVVADLYERRPFIGGIPMSGIPRFRLPREILSAELEFVETSGIRVIHEEVSDLQTLVQKYRALFLGCGLGAARSLRVPGIELDGVFQADALLEQVNGGADRPTFEGGTVVLGGGNTAIDAAATALRLGSTPVVIAYRRSEAEMPAWLEHRGFVQEEGIALRLLALPVEILGEDGRVIGVRFQAAELGEADASGRRRSVPVPGSFFVLECRQVIQALGNEESALWRTLGLAVGPHGPEVNAETQETSRPGVFAGGDATSGGGTVVQAVADGRRAARAIQELLRG